MFRTLVWRMVLLSILVLPTMAHAGVVSAQDVLNEMTSRVQIMESKNVQILDTMVGFVSRDNNTFQFPVSLTQGVETIFVGVGDTKRILDLDLVVLDQRGKEVTRDTLTDNVPVVTVNPTYTGTYMVKIIGATLAEGVNDGFFGFIRGVGADSIVSITDTLTAATMMTAYVESQNFQVEGAQWIPVPAQTDVPTTIDLSADSAYIVMGIGAPTRISDLDLTVKGPDGTVVGSDTKTDNAPVVAVTGTTQATYTVVVRASAMAGDASDGHALVIWARNSAE
jgi:hypothetical protein